MYKIPANTLFVGKNLVYVPVCHSTNTLAAELSNKTPLSEGTVVITDDQRAGRGQRGNGWEAEPGKNLTFSFIVKPTFLAIGNQFMLNQCVSLAMSDFIEGVIHRDVKIKWPNDILVNQKKVCGILIENSLSNEQIQQSIIGIGLNVNQLIFNSGQASSLRLITQYEYSLSGILDRLLECVEASYLQLRRCEFTLIQSEYLKRLYRLGETHLYHDHTTEFEGMIAGIDERGRLRIMSDYERVFDVKEVKFIL